MLQELCPGIAYVPHGHCPRVYQELLEGGQLPLPIAGKSRSAGLRSDVEVLPFVDIKSAGDIGPPPVFPDCDADFDEDVWGEELEHALFGGTHDVRSDWDDSDDVFPSDDDANADVAGGKLPNPSGASSSSTAPMPKPKGKPIATKAASKPKLAPKAKPPPRADSVNHITLLCDVRGDGRSLLKYDTQLNKLAAHCRHPLHGMKCRMQRGLIGRSSNPAGY